MKTSNKLILFIALFIFMSAIAVMKLQGNYIEKKEFEKNEIEGRKTLNGHLYKYKNIKVTAPFEKVQFVSKILNKTNTRIYLEVRKSSDYGFKISQGNFPTTSYYKVHNGVLTIETDLILPEINGPLSFIIYSPSLNTLQFQNLSATIVDLKLNEKLNIESSNSMIELNNAKLFSLDAQLAQNSQFMITNFQCTEKAQFQLINNEQLMINESKINALHIEASAKAHINLNKNEVKHLSGKIDPNTQIEAPASWVQTLVKN